MPRHLLTNMLLALFLAAGETGAAQQVVVTMTPESVDEAIRLAADEKATAQVPRRVCGPNAGGLG